MSDTLPSKQPFLMMSATLVFADDADEARAVFDRVCAVVGDLKPDALVEDPTKPGWARVVRSGVSSMGVFDMLERSTPLPPIFRMLCASEAPSGAVVIPTTDAALSDALRWIMERGDFLADSVSVREIRRDGTQHPLDLPGVTTTADDDTLA